MLMGMMGPSWDGVNHRWDAKLGMKRAFPFYLVSIIAYNWENDGSFKFIDIKYHIQVPGPWLKPYICMCVFIQIV